MSFPPLLKSKKSQTILGVLIFTFSFWLEAIRQSTRWWEVGWLDFQLLALLMFSLPAIFFWVNMSDKVNWTKGRTRLAAIATSLLCIGLPSALPDVAPLIIPHSRHCARDPAGIELLCWGPPVAYVSRGGGQVPSYSIFYSNYYTYKPLEKIDADRNMDINKCCEFS